MNTCMLKNEKLGCNIISSVFGMKSGADNQAELVDESIQHAKEAIALDVKDGDSWCKIFN